MIQSKHTFNSAPETQTRGKIHRT